MQHVFDISKDIGIFECYSDMADYDFVVMLETGDYEAAKNIANLELCRWGATSSYLEELWDSEKEYNDKVDYYYYAGYAEVVANALNKAGYDFEIFVKVGDDE